MADLSMFEEFEQLVTKRCVDGNSELLVLARKGLLHAIYWELKDLRANAELQDVLRGAYEGSMSELGGKI
ncbi:hypothetical protein [Stenotrophomonas rhizophila]|uniref:hypothetical protein n=1 Tax=Stenotrophomonas rhizophila TaxID=216778 RepID=UPI0028B26857|nr:hypothetical protein [Stenotrophomonas rhizophila]